MQQSEIARSPLMFDLPDGRRIEGAVVIGQPTASPDGGWRCGVAIEGLPNESLMVAGEDALQSLALALRLVEHRLRAFVAEGGVVREADGTPWPIDAYFAATDRG